MSTHSAAPTASTSGPSPDISAPPPSQSQSSPDNGQGTANHSTHHSHIRSTRLTQDTSHSVQRVGSVKGKEPSVDGDSQVGSRASVGGAEDRPPTGNNTNTQPNPIQHTTDNNTQTISTRPSIGLRPQPVGQLSAPLRAYTNPSPSRSPEWPPGDQSPTLNKQPTTLSFVLPDTQQPQTPHHQTQLFSIASANQDGGRASAGALETRGMTTGGGAGTNWTTRSWKASTIGGYDKKRLQALGFEEELSELEKAAGATLARRVACSGRF